MVDSKTPMMSWKSHNGFQSYRRNGRKHWAYTTSITTYISFEKQLKKSVGFSGRCMTLSLCQFIKYVQYYTLLSWTKFGIYFTTCSFWLYRLSFYMRCLIIFAKCWNMPEVSNILDQSLPLNLILIKICEENQTSINISLGVPRTMRKIRFVNRETFWERY